MDIPLGIHMYHYYCPNGYQCTDIQMGTRMDIPIIWTPNIWISDG